MAQAATGNGGPEGEPIELGARSVPTHAVSTRTTDGRTEVLVVQRIAGQAGPERAALLASLRAISLLKNPNVLRLRELREDGSDIVLQSELIEGATLADLRAARPEPPLELAAQLKVLLDVLSGLNAIHNLRDPKGTALGALHGDLAPTNIVVGLDGVARLIQPCGWRLAAERQLPDSVRYLAPEVLLDDDATDLRADIYAVGVMLLEAIAGKPFFDDTTAAAILNRHLAGRLPTPKVPDAVAWAAALVPLGLAAVSTDPGARPASASDLANAIRKATGPSRLVTSARVASLVKELAGEKIAARRARLFPKSSAKIPVAAPAPPPKENVATKAPSVPQQKAAPPVLKPRIAPKADAPKVEAPKIEAPKIEHPKAELSSLLDSEPPPAMAIPAPIVEAPKPPPAPVIEPPPMLVEAPKVVAPIVEPPKKPEPPKAEPPKVVAAAKAEPPKPEPPKLEPAKLEPAKPEPPKRVEPEPAPAAAVIEVPVFAPIVEPPVQPAIEGPTEAAIEPLLPVERPPSDDERAKKRRLMFLILGGVVGLALLIVVIAVARSGGEPRKPVTEPAATTTATGEKKPRPTGEPPATATAPTTVVSSTVASGSDAAPPSTAVAPTSVAGTSTTTTTPTSTAPTTTSTATGTAPKPKPTYDPLGI